MKLSIGLAVLSWGAPETLHQTLESYQQAGFLDLFDRKLLYFNDLCPSDEAVAEQFGYDIAGGPNLGITGGMRAMAREIGTDLVLLMQNDLPALEQGARARAAITDSAQAVGAGVADIAYLRHRFRPGVNCGWATRYLQSYPIVDAHPEFSVLEHDPNLDPTKPSPSRKALHRVLRWDRASRARGGAVFVEAEPEKLQPRVIEKAGPCYIVSSRALGYSDQSILTRPSFFDQTLLGYLDRSKSKRKHTRMRNGFVDAEPVLNHTLWWRWKAFNIAVHERGLFGHERFDGFAPHQI